MSRELYEMYVVFRGPWPTKAALSRAMRDLGFPLSIPEPDGSLEQQHGDISVVWQDEESGFDLKACDGRDLVAQAAGGRMKQIDPDVDRLAHFWWGSKQGEMVCAVCAAAALATLVNGLVLPQDTGQPLTPDAAVAQARRLLASNKLPQNYCATRPAHIKRYLESLLKQRKDLVLIERILLIRPVRHFVRGGYLSDGSEFRFDLFRYLNALYAPCSDHVGFDDARRQFDCETWQPHFPPLLTDILAEEIFADLGMVTSLTEFAPKLLPGKHRSEYVKTLVLAGERDRAADFIDKIEKASLVMGLDTAWEKSQWEFLARDVGSVCAEAHAKEAEMAQAWGLTNIWEPSRFPVELPAAERPGRSAEPGFVPRPWPKRPPGVLEPMPDTPGEIRFAQAEYRRRGISHLRTCLTREEAELRHRKRENYLVATRLSNGWLLVLRWELITQTRWVVPRYGSRPPAGSRCVFLELRNPAHVAHAWFVQLKGKSSLDLKELLVDDASSSGRIWRYDVDDSRSRVIISDHRNGVDKRANPPTDAERELHTGAIPDFCEFEGLTRRVLELFRVAGFGEFG
jgi:hypothetical protein